MALALVGHQGAGKAAGVDTEEDLETVMNNKTKNDGGPAFPAGISATLKASDDAPPTQVGMSLRQWYAGMAMMGIVCHYGNPDLKELKKQSFECADAMLSEGKANETS